ncbi:hypothetical protein JWV37_12135 [Sulfurospirillum sp. T05]|jgi:hypothetical protein|uniref:CopG family transcriptional regulator n=1 Tax=Sulfurospirillum tamanense TaxID=2813362 RepID=A0ABS2WV49_9BACT|nr:hypothetical protein [Sulfurospirillum tamanensis]MBN2965531.1 hypothetical protein [Sulfurospirillum tamanensis]
MQTVKKLFNLDASLANELELVAKTLKKSQKEVVENALDFYFDHTDGIIADKVSEEIARGKMRVYESHEVYKELGIDL